MLYTVGQGRQNVEFPNPLRSGSVRPLRTKQTQKTELGGRRRLGNGEKRGKMDVETTLSRRERGRRKNVCNQAKKTKSDPRVGLPRPEPSPTTTSLV